MSEMTENWPEQETAKAEQDAVKTAEGVVFPLQMAPIRPGEIGQLYLRLPGVVTDLVRLAVSEGGEVHKLIAGRVTIDGPDIPPVKDMPADAYLVVLVKNTLDKETLFGGAAVLKGEGLQTPPAAPDLEEARQSFEGAAPTQAPRVVVPIALASRASAVETPAGAVVPGANEVAVCLSRNDARLMLEAARNHVPDPWKWSIIRRLEDALR